MYKVKIIRQGIQNIENHINIFLEWVDELYDIKMDTSNSDSIFATIIYKN